MINIASPIDKIKASLSDIRKMQDRKAKEINDLKGEENTLRRLEIEYMKAIDIMEKGGKVDEPEKHVPEKERAKDETGGKS